MKHRLARLVMRLYPPWWRTRYGAELQALVEDSGDTWRTVADVTKGALIMQLSDWTRPAYAVLACALLGAGTGAILVAVAPPRQASVFTIEFESPSPSLEPSGREFAWKAFSDANLERVIGQFGLYRGADGPQPTPDALTLFRQDIALNIITPKTVEVSYRPDAAAAGDGGRNLKVAEQLAALVVEANLLIAEEHAKVGGPTPGRVGVKDRPRQVADRPNALPAIAVGLAAGAVAGLMVAALRRRRAPAP
jgi:hypothetical protein